MSAFGGKADMGWGRQMSARDGNRRRSRGWQVEGNYAPRLP